MSDLRDLYQEVILDHNRRPRNFGQLAEPCRHADGHNPLCGDRLTVYLNVDDGTVQDIRFEGNGCAISTASASMMTELVKGKTEAQAEALFATFRGMCTGEDVSEVAATDEEDRDVLEVLSGVREFPMRVKCATLAWHTLSAALHGEDAATTE